MLHEPKFWILALALAALFGEGINLTLQSGRRAFGMVMTVGALFGFYLMYSRWPENAAPVVQSTLSWRALSQDEIDE
jgi:hypothetical protein